MENQKLYQNTHSFIFKKVTSEERKIALHIVLDKTILKPMEKWLVGRSLKYVAKMFSNQKIKQEADGEASEKASVEVVKDNTQQLETNKRKRGNTSIGLS